jgi:transcriptional regulator with XRE-family HTH domain
MAQIRSTDTTREVLGELGGRLRTYRLQQNVTQAQLAETAGVGLATLKRTEAGENTRLETIVKILRALGRLEALDGFLPPPLVSPIRLAEARERGRKRARPSRG